MSDQKQTNRAGDSAEIPELVMHGPVDVLVRVHVIDAENVARTATMALPAGHIPTKEEVKEIIATADLPPGCRLMTKKEFWDYKCLKEVGERLAMPGKQEFED